MQVGIVGYGRIARRYLEAARATGAFAVVAAADTDCAALAGVDAGVAAYGDLHRLLADPAVEAVIVATPTRSHFEVASAAIRAKKPTLVEKPAALSLAEFDALGELAAACGVPAVCLLHYAYAAEVAAAASLLQGRGRHVAWHSRFCDPYNTNLDIGPTSLVNAWVDSGINQLSVLLSVWPDAKLTLGSALFTPPAPPQAATIAASVEFSFEAAAACGMAVLETNWSAGISAKSTRVHISSPDLMLTMDHIAEAMTLTQRGATQVARCGAGGSHLTSHYARAIPAALGLVAQGKSNWRFARSVHEPLFAAIANA